MKFLLSKELWQNQLLKWLVVLLLVMLVLFLLSDMLLHHFQIGLDFPKAIETLLGNEEAFVDAILFDSLLERIHIDLFTSTITLMLLSVIYVRVATQDKIKALLIHLSFLTAILSHIALMAGFYAGEGMIKLWVGLFIFWHMLAMAMSLYVIMKLVYK